MRDYTKEEWEESRPTVSAHQAISHCLNSLYKDRKHRREDELAPNLTYEELIGALLLARDKVEAALSN